MEKVLVVGIYLSDKDNNAKDLVRNFYRSSHYQVVQKWAALGESDIESELKQVTELRIKEKTPKFKILNRLFAKEKLGEYEFVIITDDDISLPESFIDNYLGLVDKYRFSLAQPARTHESNIDHPIVEQLDGLLARKTRFVEIGPLFSIRKDLYPYLIPFDEDAGMGWGLDSVWPCIVEEAGLSMGIVDAFPVEHKMRPPLFNYSRKEAEEEMNRCLKKKKHLSNMEKFRILESYT
jgi:hypothetical protein